MNTVTRRRVPDRLGHRPALARRRPPGHLASSSSRRPPARRCRPTHRSWWSSRCTAATTGSAPSIPYADPAYSSARPELAYTAAEVLHLGRRLGLNPAMKGMAQLWRTSSWRSSAASATRSRTTATSARWTSGRPPRRPRRSTPAGSAAGWTRPATTRLRAVNIGSVLPPLAVGAKGAAAALPLGKATTLPADLGAAFTGLGRADAADTPFQALVAASYCSERKVDATFSGIIHDAVETSDEHVRRGYGRRADRLGRTVRHGRAVHQGRRPDDGLHGQPGRVRHPRQREGHPANATGQPGQRAVGILEAAGRHTPRQGRRRDGLFGVRPTGRGERLVRAPTTGPPDRHSSPAWRVKGGFYGDQPSLTDLDDADLKSNVDFRTVYAELLAKVVKTDPLQILGPTAPQLGFLA